MSRLRPLLFAVCAVSAAAPAFAAWEEIERFDDGMRVYVRRDSLQREGDIGVLEHLVRWPEAQTGDDHPPYRSTVVRAAYHCAEKLERYLGSRSHAGVLGDGDIVLKDSDEVAVWYRVSDDSMEGKLWRIACREPGAPPASPAAGKP